MSDLEIQSLIRKYKATGDPEPLSLAMRKSLRGTLDQVPIGLVRQAVAGLPKDLVWDWKIEYNTKKLRQGILCEPDYRLQGPAPRDFQRRLETGRSVGEGSFDLSSPDDEDPKIVYNAKYHFNNGFGIFITNLSEELSEGISRLQTTDNTGIMAFAYTERYPACPGWIRPWILHSFFPDYPTPTGAMLDYIDWRSIMRTEEIIKFLPGIPPNSCPSYDQTFALITTIASPTREKLFELINIILEL